jgi:Mg-chelatase subunit ChlD
MSRPGSIGGQVTGWLAVVGVLFGLTHSVRAAEGKAAVPAPKPKVEVVFCLDTTGSMGGLIEGAKQKIWSIANQIASGKPTPEIKMGLLPYRDRGDVYITRVIDLSDDLDAIHGELMKFKAEGGGDTPESVNQALDDAVNKIKWSTDSKTLRIIFLVGDAPPHMDYKDDVKYPETCKKAVEKGIIINTVQCGNDPECRKYWQDICVKSEGTYVQIPQEGGVTVVATPFDKRLGELNADLARTTVVYGSAAKQAESLHKAEGAMGMGGMGGMYGGSSAADRAAFTGKTGRVASYDLLDAVKDKKVKLEELKKDELPPEMQKLTLEQQKAHLDQVGKKRAELTKEVVDLDKKRSEYIRQELAKQAKTDKPVSAFDGKVMDTLRKQAEKVNIKY